jgi:hypothetical protein
MSSRLSARPSGSKPIAAEEAETPRSCWTAIQSEPSRRRALAAVQYAELYACPVDCPAHDAVERVDLPHEMALAEPANRRVAGHLADGGALVGQEERARTEANSRSGSLAAGMPAADHHDVIIPKTFVHGCGMYESRRTLSRFHVKHPREYVPGSPGRGSTSGVI